MTPINQGMYEFKKESLTEIRKRMGISQSKMAELLGVPANTLSRWETGATEPDAGVLAAIYSLAKEHGISDISFFSIRKTSLEVKISSKPVEQPPESLSFYHLLRSYLSTQIETTGTELAPVVRVEVRNTAPIVPVWPKVVFTGVGLSLAHIGGGVPPRPSANPQGGNAVLEPGGSPWQYDSKRQGFLNITYHRTDGQEFPQITSDEGQHGEVLFPGQSVLYDIDTTPKELPYLQLRVEGTVSRRHLFHCEETFIMPENITKPLALNALKAFDTLDIFRPLDSVIILMPKFDSNTRLEEVQALSKALTDNAVVIKSMQEEINKIFREHRIYWFRAHLRSAVIYLDRVIGAFSRMREAIASNSPDKIVAEVSAVLALRGEASQLDHETEELMRTHNISEQDVKAAEF